MITIRPVPRDPFSERADIPFLLYDEYGGIIRRVEAFLQTLLARNMATQTLRAYAFDLLCFYRFLDSENITAIGGLEPEHAIRFLLALKHQGAAPRTINRRIVTVRSFLNFHKLNLGNRVFSISSPSFYKGRRNNALLGNSRIKDKSKKSLSVKVPSRIITPLSPVEAKHFLDTLYHNRDRAIVYFMIFCGLRTCEVLALETNDIDHIGDQFRVRGKGQKERIMPLPQSVKKSLVGYLHYERPFTSHNRCFVLLKGPLRGTPMNLEALRMIFRHRRKHSLRRVHPHLLRHTFCTNLVAQGVPLPVVQRLMGHSDIHITLDYVHMSLSDIARDFLTATETLEKTYEAD